MTTTYKPAILLRGNLDSGFALTGPFDSFDAAADYDDAVGGCGWVSELRIPDLSVSPATRDRTVVIVGNPLTGFWVWGPFPDAQAASEWTEGVDESCWVCELDAPLSLI